MRLVATVILAAMLGAVASCASDQSRQQSCPGATLRIAIDPGHDRNQVGATSARGIPEVQFNLNLARTVRAALTQAGIETVQTTDGDPMPLAARSRKAAEEGADLFLSLHHDSVQPRYMSPWTVDGVSRMHSDHFRGYSVFVSNQNPRFEESLAFARLLGGALRGRGLAPTLHHAEPIPGEGRLLLDPQLGIYRFDELGVLRSAAMPAVLFEAGIIVHRNEERELAGVPRQAAMAAAIVEAVTAWCRQR